jgi:hypothetical protein
VFASVSSRVLLDLDKGKPPMAEINKTLKFCINNIGLSYEHRERRKLAGEPDRE